MQAVRLIILSLLFVIFLPVIIQAETGQENRSEKQEDRSEKKAYACLDRHNSAFHSILSILLTKEGELVPDYSHNTYDKKFFLKLFIHPKYDRAYPSLDTFSAKIGSTSLPDRPNAISYYVYTLRKIIV